MMRTRTIIRDTGGLLHVVSKVRYIHYRVLLRTGRVSASFPAMYSRKKDKKLNHEEKEAVTWKK